MDVYYDALQTARELYGEQDESLGPLCRAAVNAFVARLRPGITADDCAETLATAAAMVAVATLRSGNTVSDFSAAALSVRFFDETDEFPAAAERMMAPYLAPSGFAFRSV